MEHKGHGEKITRKAKQAIAALLKHPTIDEAAKDCSVARNTLWRWLQDEDFQAAYRAAQREVVNAAIKDLQAATVEAVATLRRNLRCGNAFAENMAAQTILSQSLKAVELTDLIQRVERLEKQTGEESKAA